MYRSAFVVVRNTEILRYAQDDTSKDGRGGFGLSGFVRSPFLAGGGLMQ
jgi:hypothetical protein